MFASSSIKLFEVGGTAVRVHPTFFLLLLWIGAVHFIQGGPREAVTGVVFVVVLFACVVLHEFGHILMARRFGVATRGVTLLPIGGVASMDRMPEKPREEILVALAGPAVNLVIAAVLIGLLGDHLELEHSRRSRGQSAIFSLRSRLPIWCSLSSISFQRFPWTAAVFSGPS
jgi:Zn-dependent protease